MSELIHAGRYLAVDPRMNKVEGEVFMVKVECRSEVAGYYHVIHRLYPAIMETGEPFQGYLYFPIAGALPSFMGKGGLR